MKFPRRLKPTTLRLGLAGCLLIGGSAIGLTTSAASAWERTELGCRFEGHEPMIHYTVDDLTPYHQRAATTAANLWNETDAPGSFIKVDSTVQTLDVKFTYTDDPDAPAMITQYPCGNDVFYDWPVRIVINRTTPWFYERTERELAMLMAHELGHAYGLDHTYDTGASCATGTPSIMQQGTAKFSCQGDGPFADDVAGVKAIYAVDN